jgi:predicted RNase H-like HicB family nuclease
MPKYTVILIPEEEGGYSVEVPALPGCYTQGETREEALAMAKDAIGLYLESLVADGEPVPLERKLEMELVEVVTPTGS